MGLAQQISQQRTLTLCGVWAVMALCFAALGAKNAMGARSAILRPEEERSNRIPIPAESIIDMNYFAQDPVSISPDGAMVAYILRGRQPSVRSINAIGGDAFRKISRAEQRGHHVWVTDIKTRVSKKVSSGFGVSWSPDSSRLAFYSAAEEGGLKVYVWERSTGAIRRVGGEILVAETFPARGPQWTPDGTA